MKNTETVTFNFEGQGKVEMSIARCRELCPRETAAMEEAAESMTAAQQAGDMQALAQATEEWGNRFEELYRALIAGGQRRMGQQPSDIATDTPRS